MTPGERVTLTIEKPVAGGRMLARHEGAVVLVSACIPGETVEAEIERVQRGTAWARTLQVVTPSPDRVAVAGDWSCGGNVLAHAAYQRQLQLKCEIIADALARIGRLAVPRDLRITGSPVEGYRMRARLHVAGGRIGFYREGTHQICDAAETRQLLPETIGILAEVAAALERTRTRVAEVELSENCPADQRAIHLIGADLARAAALTAVRIGGVTGLSAAREPGGRAVALWGATEVSDRVMVPHTTGAVSATLTRQAHAFFQGNRFLLQPLIAAVSDAVPSGHVLDLYAGVGLFSVPLGMRGDTTVIAVEGDRTSAADLKKNAVQASQAVEAHHQAVERYLTLLRPGRAETIIVDPPRTGMTNEALRGAIALRAPRVVYVSCDVATLARDARALVEAGYALTGIQAFDLFPNTAHVETLAVFEREVRP